MRGPACGRVCAGRGRGGRGGRWGGPSRAVRVHMRRVLGSRVLRQLGRRDGCAVVGLSVCSRLRHRLRVLRRRMVTRESALLRLVMRKRDSRMLWVRQSRQMRMKRIVLAVRSLSRIARRLVVVRTWRSAQVVRCSRAIRDLPAIWDVATLAGAADEFFRIPVALRTACVAICHIMTSNVLPL